MKNLKAIRFPRVLVGLVIVAVFSFPAAIEAQQTWHAKVGAETPDMGRQALAFLPNEIWIHAGDSVTWVQLGRNSHGIVSYGGTKLSGLYGRLRENPAASGIFDEPREF